LGSAVGASGLELAVAAQLQAARMTIIVATKARAKKAGDCVGLDIETVCFKSKLSRLRCVISEHDTTDEADNTA
jgi:hypothetical protein